VPPDAQARKSILGFEEEDLFSDGAKAAAADDVFDPFAASDGTLLTAAQQLTKGASGVVISRRGSRAASLAGAKQPVGEARALAGCAALRCGLAGGARRPGGTCPAGEPGPVPCPLPACCLPAAP
jgi:hypothetical protein